MDFIPSKDEDAERHRLNNLAKELNWVFKKESRFVESICGEHSEATCHIKVSRKLAAADILECGIKASSILRARIFNEDFQTKSAQALTNILQKVGVNVRADIKTGDPDLDGNYFFEVAGDNYDYMQTFLGHSGSISLLKNILAVFRQIDFTGDEIRFYKYIALGDLDLDRVQQYLGWLHEIDCVDGIYL